MSVLTRRRIDQRRMDRYMLLLSAQMMLQIVPRCSWYMTKSYQESTCLPDMPRVSHWSILTDSNIPLHMDLGSWMMSSQICRRIDQHRMDRCTLLLKAQMMLQIVPRCSWNMTKSYQESTCLPGMPRVSHWSILMDNNIPLHMDRCTLLSSVQ